MGSFDGAETCELVGSYLLNQLPEGIKNHVGLYRDDGLDAFQLTPRRIEGIKKDICKVFSNNGLKITIEVNKKIVNFLDVTLNLNNSSYEPYSKPNNTPLYVHRESNHPPSIIKNIPLAINKRLSEISSSKESFDKAAPVYQEALAKSGYEHKLEFAETANDQPRGRRNRRRNITWYNPPFSKHVKTNVGKRFLCIVKESFPKGHPLKKIFNRNTLKISYSCMPNLERKISAHNKSMLSDDTTSTATPCNCRVKEDCPLAGECRLKNVIYQAAVTTAHGKETYVGLTATEFKTRYRNHVASFKDVKKKNATELSKFIWHLKDSKVEFSITWKILARAKPYSNSIKKCNLCTTEKYFILCEPLLSSLNKRNELTSTCRHASAYLLKYAKTLDT